MTRSSHGQRGCVIVVAACLLALLAACSFGFLGVRQGVVKLPWFDHALGPVRLVGYSTWNGNCPPYTGCDPTLHESYVIWLVIGRQAENNNESSTYRMIQLPIEHESVER